MSKVNKIARLLGGLLLLLVATVCLRAQTNQGQIAGNVLDASGAAVPNAEVVAKGEQTGVSYTAKSTSSGNYRFPSIQLGRYTLTVTAPGFKSSVNTGVEVRVGTTTSLDLNLSAGGATDTVTVSANAPTVESESSDVGGTVNTRQIVELPLALGGVGALRAPESFVFLIPGTVGPGSGNSNNGIFISQIGGGQNFGNEVLLDGASQTRSENGSSFDEEAPSVEAISEFKVTTSTPAAEFGRTTGGIENFVTKSGGNQFHGTIFDIFRNEDLNANDWFNNGKKAYYQANPSQGNEAAYNRGNDKQNDYGGSLGGPFAIPHVYNGRDKTFFFFSWEQYRHTLGGPITSDVPTLAERGGDFSDRLGSQKFDNQKPPQPIINPCDGTPLFNGQIFDPNTSRTVNGVQCRTAFTGNRIPATRISPLAQKLLAYYPLPTSAGVTGNYTLNTSSPLTNTTYSVRVDESIGSKDKIFGTYSTRENTRNSPQNFQLPAPVTPNVQTQDFLTHFGRAGWDHIFTTNILNHLNLGYNRSNSINGSIYLQGGTNYATQLGIPGITTGFPHIGGTGYVDLSRNQNDDNIDNGIRFNDSVSYQRGRNSFKIGFDYRYQQYSSIGNGTTNGNIAFSGNQTKAARTSPYQDGTGLGQASFLLGLFDNANVLIPNHQPRWISNYWAGFFQDDFKVNNSLVLNLGIRYDIDQPRKEAQNFTSNFSPTAIDPRSGLPGALVFATTCTNCNKRWADTWTKDIAPRVGFAYSPSSLQNKFVLRGGFAVLYGPLQYTDFGGATTTGYNSPYNLNSNGFDASYNLGSGLGTPSFAANLDPGFYDNGDSSSPRNFSNYIKPSYGRPAAVDQWNLQIQQELSKDLILTLGYIGSASSHLRSALENVNNTSINTFALGDELGRPFAFEAAANGTALPYANFNTNANYFQALRPFPQYDFIATDCCLQNVGHSSYQALIASLERRFSAGLNLQASYTWSKHITNADSLLPGINAGINQEQNPSNPKSTKSLSIQDIPNTFVMSYLYELPFGLNKSFGNFKNPLLRAAVSGFEIGGVQRYQSGEPISFQGATGIPGFQNFIEYTRVPGSQFDSSARRGHINPFRRLQAGNPQNFYSDPSVDSEFNGATPTGNAAYSATQTAPAFYDQNNSQNRITRARVTCPVAATPNCDNGGFLFGNVPRVTSEIRNYRYYNEDFSFLKKTPITEGSVFTLKVELLNAFNRHAFQAPNDNHFNQPNDPNFGVPTSTINGPRQMQLTARIQF